MSYVLAFLGFAALIILHEAGHFVAAKAVGMRVERFSLFFGPMLVKFRRGETEYGIGPIPLGGYVKITGMNPNEEIPPEARPRAYYNQPVWKRVVVILAGPVVNLVIAFVIVWVLLLSNGQIGARSTGSAAVVARDARRDGAQAGRQARVGRRRRRARRRAPRTRIGAHRCAGTPVGGLPRDHARCTIVVRRHGQLLTLHVRPVLRGRAEADGARIRVRRARPPIPGPARRRRARRSRIWPRSPAGPCRRSCASSSPQERRQLHGVVGGYETTQQSFATSTSLAFEVLALISLSLGVINLFPFLPLDGGHIFWALAEKVRGRRISFAVMERAGVVGFVLIIMLFFVGLSNDISHARPGGGFSSALSDRLRSFALALRAGAASVHGLSRRRAWRAAPRWLRRGRAVDAPTL